MNNKQEKNNVNKKCFAVMINGKVNRFRTQAEMYSFAGYKNNVNEWRRFYQFVPYELPHGNPRYGEWREIGVLPPIEFMSDYMRYMAI